MTVGAVALLYIRAQALAHFSLSLQLRALARVALSTHIPIVWVLLLCTFLSSSLACFAKCLVFSNELTTIHEYLTQYVLSRLSSIREHAPKSFPASHAFP